MPPIVFFIGIIVLIGVIAAYVILEKPMKRSMPKSTVLKRMMHLQVIQTTRISLTILTRITSSQKKLMMKKL